MNMRIPRPKGPKQRLIVLGTVLAIVAASGLTTAAVLDRGDEPDPSPVMVKAATTTTTRATTTTTTTTTVPETTTTTLTTVPFRLPEAPPKHPYQSVPVVQLGTITIPEAGLFNHPVYEGIWLTVLDKGPGHWPGTAAPGEVGNSVFPGHRVTNSHPFLNIDQLVPGDGITFTMPNGEFTYEVTETIIVKPKDMWVTDPTTTATVTIIACHPKRSAAQRIVVKGKLVSSTPPPA